MSYKITTITTFEVEGYCYPLEIEIEFDEDAYLVSDTRKNGQEDTHMAERVFMLDGAWVFESDEDDDGYNTFRQYHSNKLADGILAFLKKYGPPPRRPNVELIVFTDPVGRTLFKVVIGSAEPVIVGARSTIEGSANLLRTLEAIATKVTALGDEAKSRSIFAAARAPLKPVSG